MNNSLLALSFIMFLVIFAGEPSVRQEATPDCPAPAPWLDEA